MYKITYLDHSGYMIQTPEVLLVFDYCHDPAHKVIKTLSHNQELPVVFFISHADRNHINHEIFNLGQNHERLYIISNDFHDRKDNLNIPIGWISPGDTLDNLPGKVKVKAYSTTRRGCSFVVTTATGRNIFHGGELGRCDIHDGNSPKDIAACDEKFAVIVNRIAEDHPSFDLTMMAVDTTDGSQFAKNASYFLHKIKVADFVPFHIDDPKDKACEIADYPFSQKVDTRLICLTSPGESAEF